MSVQLPRKNNIKSDVHSNYMYRKIAPANITALEISFNEKWMEKHI